MGRAYGWLAAVLIIGSLQLAGCGERDAASEGARDGDGAPAKIEHVEGSDVSRVKLTAAAAKRLDIQTALVSRAEASGTERTVIPYAAVLYDLNGDAWTYTNPEPLTFIRRRINVESIKAGLAVLLDGPATGTKVVTVGAAELFGAEFEFQED